MRNLFTPSLCLTDVRIYGDRGFLGETIHFRGGVIRGLGGAPERGEAVIQGGGCTLIPGMVNAHDHLQLNNFERLKFRPGPYLHARQWVTDFQQRFGEAVEIDRPRAVPLPDRLWIGGLKNLLSGATSVAHHDPFYKTLQKRFPVRLAHPYGFCHSLYLGGDILQSYQTTPAHVPWMIHLAEGVDEEARGEFERLAAMDLLRPNTVVIHGVGMNRRNMAALAERGRGLVWCPASNLFLFEQTARPLPLSRAGKLALGTDSRLSGSGDLLAELRVAQNLNCLSPERLFRAVTRDAASMLNMRDHGVGDLVAGGVADWVMFPTRATPFSFERVPEMSRADLSLVVVGGKPAVGDPCWAPFFNLCGGFENIRLDGRPKLLRASLARRLRRAAVLERGLELEPKG